MANLPARRRRPLAKDADSIGYDAATQRLYIVNGGKDAGQPYSMVSVVDTTAGKKLAEIRIDGETLEAMALDAFRPRLYQQPGPQSVAVVDRWKNTVVASWPVKLASDNVAMALDETHQRLFVGCRSGQAAVFDTNTGKELQALPITKGVDDMTYDVASKRLYAIGGGMVDVLQEVDADHFRALGNGGSRRSGMPKTGRRTGPRSIVTSRRFRKQAAARRRSRSCSRCMYRSRSRSTRSRRRRYMLRTR